MAALIVRNGTLGIYNNTCNFVLDYHNDTHQHLSILPTPPIQSSTDSYLGLVTYCSAFSSDSSYYAVTDQKTLYIWSTRTWELVTKTLERSASKITFTPRDDAVVVADKTGDVYVYALSESTPKGTRILGHLSILLDVLVTPDSKYIITCDRDEKIRVSCYPNGYNIQCFCLGHTEFVTRITFSLNTLVSCSGDGTVKYWSYLDGKESYSYDISKDLQEETHLDQYLITNIATIDYQDYSTICLSVHKYNGVLVYKSKRYDGDKISVEIVQKIQCEEPLNIATNTHSLWILSNSESSILSVWSWNTIDKFERTHDKYENNAINVVNRECSKLIKASFVDLSVLYKKYQMNEEKRKKIRLQ
ncbi:tRNA (guanine-N(7)-)-methyltransferase non-catalytic subunit wuho [Planococcus citri]|uniref:tRNA (guanine-N(7)-)-methyltransferase non-catalytic subunit wuho n=1 Tax=Planococcus citri TaxID=170843 RepID=UPI0031F7A8F1